MGVFNTSGRLWKSIFRLIGSSSHSFTLRSNKKALASSSPSNSWPSNSWPSNSFYQISRLISLFIYLLSSVSIIIRFYFRAVNQKLDCWGSKTIVWRASLSRCLRRWKLSQLRIRPSMRLPTKTPPVPVKW